MAMHQALESYWTGKPVTLSEDSAEMEKTREAAEEMTQRAASRLGDARPASVNVHMVNGFTVRELIDASRDADLVVVGWRGGGGFRPAHDGLGEQPGRPSRRVSGCRPARVRADPPRKTIRTTITITPANRASDGVAPALWTNSAGHALVDHAWRQAAPMWPSPAGGGLNRAWARARGADVLLAGPAVCLTAGA